MDRKKKQMVKKRSKKLILLLLIMIVVFAGWWIWAVSAGNVQHENIYVKYTSQKEDAPNAIVIYQPGRTSFSQEVAEDLARGIRDTGYNVVLTTPNDKLTKDLSGYRVVVFESPVYMGMPTKAMKAYLEGVENFGVGDIYFCCTGMLASTPEFKTINTLFKNKELSGLFKLDKATFLKSKTYAYELGVKMAGL